jgi:hypothetical protein
MPRWSQTHTSHPRELEASVSDDVSQERMKRLLSDSEAALRHALAFRHMDSLRRLALHRPHYNPNQPRVPAGKPDGGQWTNSGADAGRAAAADGHIPPISSQPESVMSDGRADTIKAGARFASRTHITIDPEVLTGISTIDDATMALTDTLARVMDAVGQVPGISPQRYGMMVHTAFAAAVRLMRWPGIGFWDVETTFSLIPGARYGSKDSIRTDVVLRNEAGDVIAIYDVKTGDADLSPARVNKLLAKTRAAPGTPVIQMHVKHGLSLKAEQIGPNLGALQASSKPRLSVTVA